MALVYNNSVVRDGLVLHLDAANPKSYPGAGSVWYDLSGRKNNATLYGSPVFSGGRVLFDGISTYAAIPFNPTDFTFDYEQTVILIMSPTENDANRRNPYDQAYGGGGTWTHEPSGGISWYYGTAGTNTIPYTSYGSVAVTQGETAMMATTRKSNQYRRWYKNGIMTAGTTDSVYPQVITGTNPIQIGRGYAGWYLGYIDVVMVYNKSLTTEQIAQNFEAYRGRYGI